MANPITSIKNLYNETVAALKKCTWPERAELKGETVAVITFLFISTVFLFVADQIFMAAVGKLCM